MNKMTKQQLLEKVEHQHRIIMELQAENKQLEKIKDINLDSFITANQARRDRKRALGLYEKAVLEKQALTKEIERLKTQVLAAAKLAYACDILLDNNKLLRFSTPWLKALNDFNELKK